MYIFSSWRAALLQRGTRMVAALWAGFYYLVEPDAAFLALMIAVSLDLITKLISIIAQNGGVSKALLSKRLSSQQAFKGTFLKLVAYLSLSILAVQAKHVAPFELAATLSQTVVFSFLFTVESISILENLVDAGFSDLAALLVLIKQKAP